MRREIRGGDKRPRTTAAIGSWMIALALGTASCADKNGSGACGWLYAPPSFIDAGHSACEAEPAGSHCDTTTERCPTVCLANEYVLTCRTREDPTAGLPNRGSQDPTVSDDVDVSCSPLHVHTDGGVTETTYCCHCER